MRRAGLRCFTLLPLLRTPQHIQPQGVAVFPQPSLSQTGQPLMASTVTEVLWGINDFSLVQYRLSWSNGSLWNEKSGFKSCADQTRYSIANDWPVATVAAFLRKVL